MNSTARKPRLLAFIVAYNAEKTIEHVLQRIPASLADDYDVEVLVIDDASKDRTFEISRARLTSGALPFKTHVLVNPVNQGYGGNQKLGYRFAAEKGFDIVALVHGDGQYAPERLPDLVAPIAEGQADAVLGSRMMSRFGALKGGMPLYKFVGNRILTWLQNRLLGSKLAEFHTGYRIYAVSALRKIPFERNSNDFDFDTHIIIQLMRAKMRILELPIPTYYGKEISYVNGLSYAFKCVVSSLKARAQDFGLFYDPKFDCQPSGPKNERYESKVGWPSTHSLALELVGPNVRVVDFGCAGGAVARALKKKGCTVTGVDIEAPRDVSSLDHFVKHDLDSDSLPLDIGDYDTVLMLDIIEHLESPEAFLASFRDESQSGQRAVFMASTGNVGFIVTRLLLLFGQFNYGNRGILDVTHRRLFTFATFRRVFEQAGFEVVKVKGVPAPFPLALGTNRLSGFLLWMNRLLIHISKPLFSYQIFLLARLRPSLGHLMREAYTESEIRVNKIAVNEDPVQSAP